MARLGTVRRIARGLLAALLYAQSVLSFAGCGLPARSAADAIAASALPPCHQSEAKNNAVCVTHCLGEYQSLDKPAVVVPVWIDAPVLVVGMAYQPLARLAIARERPRPAAGPPPRILLHSFLI